MPTQPTSSRATGSGSWTGVLRDYPWPAVVVGAGLGYLLYRCFGMPGRGGDAGYRYDERRTAARAFEAGL